MKRCMIVDGSSVIRKVARRILNGPDLLVLEAATGGDALAMCRTETPDIIVVDASLQDMNVVEFIRQASGMSTRLKPHIAISVTEFDVGAIMRARRAGAQSYILKPFDRSQLLQCFREMHVAAGGEAA